MKRFLTEGFWTKALGMMVMVACMAVVGLLSYDILSGVGYDPLNPQMRKLQLWVCSIFFLDFWVRFIVSHQRWNYFKRNILLLLFAIPYLNIVHHTDLVVSAHIHYLLAMIPLLRGGFGLIMIVRWFTRRTATSLMISYLFVLSAIVYFSSLVFYVAEGSGVNPQVQNYWDALWWAAMVMDTVGSNIEASTAIGRVLSVVLACSGMMMLPVFTVYVTDRIAQDKKTASTK
ncbi:MAG: ion channel [Mucinivorans sp.]